MAKVDAHVIQPEEYEEVPEVTDEMFARGTVTEGGKPARRGRPPADATKTPTTIRLDADVLAHFKATGPGWQTRINEALRPAAGLS
ncbi:BrnA antitoxin family protein [Azospirillum sp. ST 5-10]|uniref:BrnA antitoxin family protein n=1 Tax=unclassified Azospirillum TaxID=2630922 RepID=UPI003F49CDA1